MRITLMKCGIALATAFALFSGSVSATDIPKNLGFGLDKLVESNVIVKADRTKAIYNGFATQQAASYFSLAITDDASNRVLVDIVPGGKIDIDTLSANLQATLQSLTINSVDYTYRGVGMIEAFVSVDDATALAQTDGVRAVFLGLKPYLRHGPVQAPSVLAGDHLYKIGTTFDQGVTQHRVDRINQIYNPAAPVNYDGRGMSIGLLSDSFNTKTSGAHAVTGVANFDLPGSPSNPWNTQPVVVLQDEPGGTDEGRAMTEIAYKMAPRARLAFATADSGELGFANNIRALAALPGFVYLPGTQQGFKADTIADDVGYFDEPWYEDGIISNAVDDVAAAGVSYFSSAGNDIGMNGYESPLRIVPNGAGLTAAAGNTALAGTNINLAGVPVGLYAGGFHNFNPAPGQLDVAQTVNMPNRASNTPQAVVMQWDDPFDSSEPPTGTQVFSATGTISTTTTTVTFNGASTPTALPQFTQGLVYVITETAAAGASLDGTVTVLDNGGNVVYTQDNDVNEIVHFYPPTSGQYQIRVGRFSGTGNFTLTVNETTGTLGVTTDLNLLVFRADTGAYIATSSLTSNNLAFNRPIELGPIVAPSGTPTQTQVQFVIARANTPTATALPTRVRWLAGGDGLPNIGPAEYFTYNTVTTGGHPTAAGANGMAAYGVFRPSIPEFYTSPGPATILFDKNSQRLATPEVRQQPRLAAADNANESFFSGDVGDDLDTNPNFSGTSAAGPHAAAIAALVLQSRGGPGSVTPAQMTSILQATTFPHDLDPNFASGTAMSTDGGTVNISITSDGESNTATGQNDPSSFKVSYSGAGSLASLTFNPAGTDIGGGNPTGGNNGYQDDAGSLPATVSYFDNTFPGMAFAVISPGKVFTLGPLTNVSATDITQPLSVAPFTGFSNQPPAPANITGLFRTMTIGFPNANFADGAAMSFTVGRGTQHSSTVGTVAAPVNGTASVLQQADLFGGGVQIPSGIVTTDGMTFSGTTTGGGTFAGTIKNNIGRGYSVVDGYGFIDAAAATSQFIATGTATPASGFRSSTTLLTVTVTPAASPTSTGVAVTANLVGIGGSASQAFTAAGSDLNGNLLFTATASVSATALAGPKSIPVAITDAQGRSGTATIIYTVLAPTNPSGIGAATPTPVSATQTTLLTVAVTPGAGPASTTLAVKADLSSIGGSAATVFHDDGLNGDLISGDKTFSFSEVVPLGTAAGTKTFPITITDAQARTGTTNIALTILASTPPTATGSASPPSVAATESSVLTVTVVPGTNPPSSGTAVTADLTSIGGIANQSFNDNTDGTFSFNATVPLGTAAGAKSFPVSVTDAQLRNASTSIALTVAAPMALSASGSATPSAVLAGGTSHLNVIVVPGANPASSGIQVVADLSSIGGNPTQAFTDDGAGTSFSYDAMVAMNTSPGVKLIPATATDAQGRTANVTLGLNVPAPGSPYATGIGASAIPGDTVTLQAVVTPGSNPVSSGILVNVDLSALGGSASQQFFDDGSNGDQAAGDGIYSFQITVAAGTPIDTAFNLPVTVTDSQSRNGSGSIPFNTLDDRIFADGFGD